MLKVTEKYNGRLKSRAENSKKMTDRDDRTVEQVSLIRTPAYYSPSVLTDLLYIVHVILIN